MSYNRADVCLEINNMEKFLIEGGVPLHGEVIPAGNKNAALPLLAACLLTDEPIVLHNVPQIKDVSVMRHLIESVGAHVEHLDATSWRVTAQDLKPAELDPDLCRRIRASILVAGPLAARIGAFKLPPPGGDVIGRRRLDTHIIALRALGAEVGYDRGFLFNADGLQGADFLMDEASVTATENAIMAAVTAEGDTVIRNAASEPHVQELCHFLNGLGAQIEEIGSNTLHIHGVTRLHGGEFTIGPDYLEVISFVGAAAITHGSIRIKNAGVDNLSMIGHIFERMGVTWNVEDDDLIVPAGQELKVLPDLDGAIPEIKTNVWPAFPTDLISIAITVAPRPADPSCSMIGCFPDACISQISSWAWAPGSFCAIRIAVWFRDRVNCMPIILKARISVQACRCCWQRSLQKGRLLCEISARSSVDIRTWIKSFVN
jgi:UDP-N-acetylglucosamine 1-carboxyvinyltransferase